MKLPTLCAARQFIWQFATFTPIRYVTGDHLYPEIPDYLGDPNKKQLNVFKGSLRESEVFSTSPPSPTSSTGLNRIEFKVIRLEV